MHPVVEDHPPARTKVDLGGAAAAEPGTQELSLGQHLPDPFHGRPDDDLTLDAVGNHAAYLYFLRCVVMAVGMHSAHLPEPLIRHSARDDGALSWGPLRAALLLSRC